MRAGDHNRTQRMFRARILAQAFTLVAVVVGSMYWKTDRQKRKEFDAVIAERKAMEKRELWVKELEARDEEDKQLRAKRDAFRKGKVSASGIDSIPRGGSVASSMIDEREGKGTLALVIDLVYKR
jgi:hypothetical protein